MKRSMMQIYVENTAEAVALDFSAYPRIAIVGSPGSGKSTLARQIAAETGHPLIHLDYEHWSAGWTHPSKDEWRAMNEEFVRGARWIIDGNYGGTMELRCRAANLVIFLDVPRMVCIRRVIRRRGVQRPDMKPEVQEESPILSKDFLKFLWFIWQYPKKGKRKIMALKEKYPAVEFLTVKD